MEKNKTSLFSLFSVLFSFCIVGACGIVGFSASYMQQDFQLDNTWSGVFPATVFIWFLVLSVPAAGLANRIGCRRTVLLGNSLTLLGMLLPFLWYRLSVCIGAFVLLGIGNVLLQVALNPLLTFVFQGNAKAAYLTAGRMLKDFSAFCGPFIAAFAVNVWGDWHYVFGAFAMTAVLSALWLWVTPLPECGTNIHSTFRDTFSLLKDTSIACFFIAAICIVGIDVGMNLLVPKLMMERCGNAVQDAALGSSVYFAFRVLGVFAGFILLPVLPERKFFRFHVLVLLFSLLLLIFPDGEYGILVLSGVAALGCSSVFFVLCSILLQEYPDKINEISLLMMTGMCGGAFIPLAMGMAANAAGTQNGALIVMVVCTFYLLYSAFCITFKKIRK